MRGVQPEISWLAASRPAAPAVRLPGPRHQDQFRLGRSCGSGRNARQQPLDLGYLCICPPSEEVRATPSRQPVFPALCQAPHIGLARTGCPNSGTSGAWVRRCCQPECWHGQASGRWPRQRRHGHRPDALRDRRARLRQPGRDRALRHGQAHPGGPGPGSDLRHARQPAARDCEGRHEPAQRGSATR
jgi:hypothetical protein